MHTWKVILRFRVIILLKGSMDPATPRAVHRFAGCGPQGRCDVEMFWKSWKQNLGRFVGSLVGWLVRWFVGSLVGWLVCWSVGPLVRWLVGWLVVKRHVADSCQAASKVPVGVRKLFGKWWSRGWLACEGPEISSGSFHPTHRIHGTGMFTYICLICLMDPCMVYIYTSPIQSHGSM